MRPGQLSHQWSDNLDVGKYTGKFHHLAQTFSIVASTVFFRKIVCEARDNLLAIGGMFTAKHLTVDAFANMLVHQGHAGVDSGRDLKP